MTHCPAHDAPKNVAPALVGRQHAVGNKESCGPQMVGDDPVAGLVLAFRAGVGQFLAGLDQRPKQVGIVVVGHALEDGSDALQPHSGVDALARQL